MSIVQNSSYTIDLLLASAQNRTYSTLVFVRRFYARQLKTEARQHDD